MTYSKMITETAPSAAVARTPVPDPNETSFKPFVTPHTKTGTSPNNVNQVAEAWPPSVNKAELKLWSVELEKHRVCNSPDHLTLKKQLREKAAAAVRRVKQSDVTIWDESGDVRPTHVDVSTLLNVASLDVDHLSVPSLVDETFTEDMDVSSLEGDDSDDEIEVDYYDVDESSYKPDLVVVDEVNTFLECASKYNHDDDFPLLTTPEGNYETGTIIAVWPAENEI